MSYRFFFNDKKTQDFEIVILHTNDMHAHIDNLPKLAALIASERAQNPYTILVSAGDIFSGNPYIDFAPEKGKPYITLLNKLGYVVHTMGNHEFDYVQEILNKRMDEANFPFIMANYTNVGAPLRSLAPYHIFRFEEIDFSIAFVGLIENSSNGIPSTQPKNVTGLKFESGLSKMSQYLHLAEENNLLVALSHLGVDDDMEMAQKYEGIDLIIGGHSHTSINPAKLVNNTLVAQTGAYGKNLGKITLKVRDGKVVEKSGELITIEDYPESDREMAQMVETLQNDEFFNRAITTLESKIDGKAELGCMITDAFRSIAKADIAFHNSGGIRVRELPAGPIKVKDIFTMDPFGNEMVKLALSRKEIENLLLGRSGEIHKIDLFVSGMQYQAVTDKDGKFIELKMQLGDGTAWDDNKKYTVVVNSYVAAVYEYEKEDDGESLYMTTADAVIKYLEQQPSMDYAGCERAKLVKVE